MQTLRRLLFLALLSVWMAIPAGCAGTLSSIITGVQDATLIISSIESFENAYFAAHPDPIKQTKVGEAIEKARTALDAALRAANGAGELGKTPDQAFADFRAAYTDLLALVKPLGVTATGATLAAAPGGGLVVPEPLLFKLK